ncbi:MAG: gamma-glutamyltransferase family protein [Actinobacteria bacterium]|nr:MAG: gamma-glutamyltransferase family protein [Actinomycetota bacterium]
MTARPPSFAARAMAATSQPLATLAALRLLERGGNAADAAIGAAAVLSVTEPMATGLGGDAFALVRRDGEPAGLDAAGPAPAEAPPDAPIAVTGPQSVTVPGAVAGWAALSERFGRLGLDACLASAVDAAANGFAVGARTAAEWRRAPALPGGFGPAPRAGATFRHPELAASLRAIAEEGPQTFYTGATGRAIASACWLSEADLAGYEPRWVAPLRHGYRGVEVVELPPPTQGVAALEALALLERAAPTPANAVTSVRLALEDALATVRDGADVTGLLEAGFVAQRLCAAAREVREPAGGTVYLCVVDEDRMAVSFIQSLFGAFGSGVVAPGTGIVLHNRGACFAVGGAVEPGRRPYHTLMPGLLLRDGGLLGPFGVMGAFIQAQAQVQFVSAVVDEGLDPQAALDRPRFRVDRRLLRLEEGLDPGAFAGLGLEVRREGDITEFGGGQAILAAAEGLVGGSDSRKDGVAAGF